MTVKSFYHSSLWETSGVWVYCSNPTPSPYVSPNVERSSVRRLRRKRVVFGVAVVVIAIMVLTNPSEDKHLDHFVAIAQARQAEHVEICSRCDSVTDADDLRMMATSKLDEGGILLGEGLRRKDYFVFSVLTEDGVADAVTVGVLGCVFGPTFSTPYPCPKENTMTLPESRSVSEFAATFEFSVLADGSLRHNGESVTRDELKARLTAIAGKDSTAITIDVGPGAKFQTVTEIMKWVSSLEFSAVTIAINHESDPSSHSNTNAPGVTVTLDRLAAMLPEGSRDRTLVSQLAEYAQRDAGCGHEDFRVVSDGEASSRAWFAGDAETAKQFVVIGETTSSGLFAVWMYDGSTPATAPIVFLGSEGAAKVIANGFGEFLSLLAVPYDDLEFTFSDDAWSLRSETTDQLEQFRAWLAKECGIQPADDVAGLISTAQSQHPSLNTFVEQWAANR